MITSPKFQPRPNKFPGWCHRCSFAVAEGAGRVVDRDDFTGRWVISCMSCWERRFRTAPPPPPPPRRPIPPCLDVLGLAPPVTRDDVGARFRVLAMEHHPDCGGDARRFIEVRAAYHEALALVTPGGVGR